MAGKTVKLCAVLFAVLMFAATAGAQVYVNISPMDAEGVLELYPNEVATYEIVVFNSTPETIENFNIRVSVDEGLAIVDGLEERTMKSFKVGSLDTGRSETLRVKVKVLQSRTEQYYISANSGFEKYTNVEATYLTVRENDVQVNTRISKSALNIGEENSVFLDIKNNSEGEVHDIVALLLVPRGIKNISDKLELSALAAGEGFTDKEFKFLPEPGTVGEKTLVLRVSYVLDDKTHLIEKTFDLEIQNRDIILYIIIILILVLVVMSLMTRKKSKRKKESVAVYEAKKPTPETSPQ